MGETGPSGDGSPHQSDGTQHWPQLACAPWVVSDADIIKTDPSGDDVVSFPDPAANDEAANPTKPEPYPPAAFTTSHHRPYAVAMA